MTQIIEAFIRVVKLHDPPIWVHGCGLAHFIGGLDFETTGTTYLMRRMSCMHAFLSL